MYIRSASKSELDILINYDKHVNTEILKNKIENSTILIAFIEDDFIGWLRFNYFWDEHPFMNMLYVLEQYRGRGYGSALVDFWEVSELKKGHRLCMVSTMSNETSQEFYRKRGYIDIGGFVLDGEPMEIIMTKVLVASDNNVI